MSGYALIKACLLFPAVHCLLLLSGAGLCWLRKTWGLVLIIGAVILLYACSIPYSEQWLARALQAYPSFTQNDINPKAQAIVVLDSRGPVGEQSRRLAWVATLHQQQNIPVIVSGKGGSHPLSSRLQRTYHTPVIHIDNQSTTTWEHAKALTPYLKKHGIHHFYLMASSWHIKRAMWVFERLGWQPTAMSVKQPRTPASHPWIPNARSLLYANYAYYEHIGLAWYRLKAWLGDAREFFCAQTQTNQSTLP